MASLWTFKSNTRSAYLHLALGINTRCILSFSWGASDSSLLKASIFHPNEHEIRDKYGLLVREIASLHYTYALVRFAEFDVVRFALVHC